MGGGLTQEEGNVVFETPGTGLRRGTDDQQPRALAVSDRRLGPSVKRGVQKDKYTQRPLKESKVAERWRI